MGWFCQPLGIHAGAAEAFGAAPLGIPGILPGGVWKAASMLVRRAVTASSSPEFHIGVPRPYRGVECLDGVLPAGGGAGLDDDGVIGIEKAADCGS